MAIAGFFERYMYRVMALGWLKIERKKERKKKERKKEDEQFRLSTHFCLMRSLSVCLSVCLLSVCQPSEKIDRQIEASQQWQRMEVSHVMSIVLLA